MRVIRIYIRRSDEKQAGSVATQRAHCDAYAALHYPGASVVYYVDGEGKHKRDDIASHTEWTRLLADLHAGDVVLVYEASRIGADLEYLCAIDAVGKAGASLIETSSGDLLRWTGELEDFKHFFKGKESRSEVTKIRIRTRDGLRRRAKEGHSAHFLGYGYRAVAINPTAEKSEKVDEIDPEQAAIVIRMNTEYADGAGYLMIAKGLNTDGVRGPSRGEKRNGKVVRPVWTGETIRKMLVSPIYRGVVTYVGVTYQRPELAIVGPELAARVDAARAARSKLAVPRPRHIVHPIAGWGRCDECKGSIASHTTGAGSVKYVCDRRRRIGDCDVKVRVPVEIVEGAIIAGLMTDLLSDMMIAEIRGAIRGALAAESARAATVAGVDTAALRVELAEAQGKKRRLLALAAATDDADAHTMAKDAAGDVRLLEQRIAVAQRPSIDDLTAARIEADAVARLKGIRASLSNRSRLREALQALFPEGLRFIPDGNGWIIEGDAAPGVHQALERPTELGFLPSDRGSEEASRGMPSMRSHSSGITSTRS